MRETVEAMFEKAIEDVRISTLIIGQKGWGPVEERIDWMIELLEEARRLHRASVKKQARLERAKLCGACGFPHSEHDDYGARDGCPGWSSDQ